MDNGNEASQWLGVVETATLSVVFISSFRTSSFEGGTGSSSRGTGFVIDTDRRWILTNRHVVGFGPFCGRCTFQSGEEVRKESLQIMSAAS